MKTNQYIFSVLLLLFFSCTFTTDQKKVTKDQEKALVMVENFYKYIAIDDYSKLSNLIGVSEKFTAKEMDSIVYGVVNSQDKLLGKVDSRVLKSIESNVDTSKNHIVKYNVIYETIRNRKRFKETFDLVLQGNDIKVDEYLVTPIKG